MLGFSAFSPREENKPKPVPKPRTQITLTNSDPAAVRTLPKSARLRRQEAFKGSRPTAYSLDEPDESEEKNK
jgi:hypothetical protein